MRLRDKRMEEVLENIPEISLIGITAEMLYHFSRRFSNFDLICEGSRGKIGGIAKEIKKELRDSRISFYLNESDSYIISVRRK